MKELYYALVHIPTRKTVVTGSLRQVETWRKNRKEYKVVTRRRELKTSCPEAKD